MTARILDGQRIAEQMRAELAGEAADFQKKTGVQPHLVVVIVGDDPASQVYVRNKRLACEKAGMKGTVHALPASTPQTELLALVDRLNRDQAVHGILVQFPLPNGLDEVGVVRVIHPLKDVDCFHAENVGLLAEGHPRFLPCTPAGVQEILIREKIDVAGADVVIVGRSNLVGRPLALMLSQKGAAADATVTICHSRTRNLAEHTRRADVLIAAIGKAEFIRGSMIRPGAVVIDVGINRNDAGKLVGDVAFDEAKEVASAITPVPRGVGPMTVTMLLANTIRAAKLAVGGAD